MRPSTESRRQGAAVDAEAGRRLIGVRPAADELRADDPPHPLDFGARTLLRLTHELLEEGAQGRIGSGRRSRQQTRREFDRCEIRAERDFAAERLEKRPDMHRPAPR